MCLGIPGQIVDVSPDGMQATVDISGARRTVNILCVLSETHTPDSLLGAWVLIHVGFAMSIIDEEEAKTSLALLQEIGEAEAELSALRGGS